VAAVVDVDQCRIDGVDAGAGEKADIERHLLILAGTCVVVRKTSPAVVRDAGSG
jgi:hypothetical protein